MELSVVDYEGRPAPYTTPLVRVGDDYMVRELDDLLERKVRTLPAFTHKNTINFFFLNKGVKLQTLVIYAPWVHIHNIRYVEALQKFVVSFNSYKIFLVLKLIGWIRFSWYTLDHWNCLNFPIICFRSAIIDIILTQVACDGVVSFDGGARFTGGA